MSLDNEKIYYKGNNVLITSTRAEMADKTFVMSNITSVSLKQVSEGVNMLQILWGIFLGVALIIWAASHLFKDAWLMLGVIGLVIIIATLFALRTKAEYAVNISSASGETKAMQSTNQSEIEKVVAAIKQAIIDAGVQKVEAVSASQFAKSGDDVLQKLQSLKSLLDSGIITTQEYEAKKLEILSRM